ncbi:transglycosylase SLT domain-containing protein [Pelagibacterium xiamenense]|uniref:transglycosylase SLT domain-containing protein n=1 Tax=Pelagibacterium xiamenense TaxID=2901140 RepID=UPI001E646AC2|nr:transglycosylase SLT domain-containing protein [Pelagibacterium xiamenense]MCD7059902.1 transglycosylase SLT domain-containing protein [Pelagibacterium xiamenense]
MPLSVSSIPPPLAYAIDRAGQRNGVDFDYLVQTAIRESSLNPNAEASTSSATGLFQFIESTWLEVMKYEGPRLGYADLAAHIEGEDGELFVRDPNVREQILDLRRNPEVAADMAAAFTRRNGDYLQQKFGRMPSPGELYIAHFLGARGAERFFEAGLSQPNAIAAELFPRPAAANRAIFYENGQPRTVREVYEALVARHNGTSLPNAQFATQQLASAEPLPSRFEIEGPVMPEGVSFTSLFSTQVEGATGSPLNTEVSGGGGRPLFSGLYGDE